MKSMVAFSLSAHTNLIVFAESGPFFKYPRRLVVTVDLGSSRRGIWYEIRECCIGMRCGVVKSVAMLRKLGWMVTRYRMQPSGILGVMMLRMLRMQM